MIPSGFKPTLAIDFNKVNPKKQPANRVASAKLDGIRCTIFDGVAYSRNLKPIPNTYIQNMIYANRHDLQGIDCEIIVGPPTAADVFSVTTSFVMARDKVGEFFLYCFDKYDGKANPFHKRDKEVQQRVFNKSFALWLPQIEVKTQQDIDNLEADYIEMGYEGIMLRDNDSYYRCGRSGTAYPELQKVKRFVDSEFKIVGFEPKYHNVNEATTNELGRTKRSSAKSGLVPLDELGAFILEVPDGSGRTFNCGSGLSDKQRKEFWRIRFELMNALATVKYFEVGMQDGIPRFPIFKGIRWKDDL